MIQLYFAELPNLFPNVENMFYVPQSKTVFLEHYRIAFLLSDCTIKSVFGGVRDVKYQSWCSFLKY